MTIIQTSFEILFVIFTRITFLCLRETFLIIFRLVLLRSFSPSTRFINNSFLIFFVMNNMSVMSFINDILINSYISIAFFNRGGSCLVCCLIDNYRYTDVYLWNLYTSSNGNLQLKMPEKN